MSVRDNLIAARALIDTPKKWVKSDSEATECRCAALACEKYTRSSHQSTLEMYDMWEALYHELPSSFHTDPDEHGVCIGRYNDSPATTHADIMALFDRAIAAQGAA